MAQAALRQAATQVPVESERTAAAAAAIPDILYIMGTGRSGTTILEILLAANPGVTGVGEVKHIFRDGFLRDLPCGCGRRSRECDLWASVLRASGWTASDWEGLATYIERTESHARFPAAWLPMDASKIARYRQANQTLFSAVGAAQNCRLIVDSSKYAGRALLLARCFPDKVKVLCITRSAAGMFKAFKKKNDGEQRPKSVLAVTAYYLYVLLCMRLVKSRLAERCHVIRFEDLNRDPRAVLADIEAWSGYSLARTQALVAQNDWFEVGHIVTGNRLRKAGRVKFEPASAERATGARPWSERVLSPLLEAYRKLLGF